MNDWYHIVLCIALSEDLFNRLAQSPAEAYLACVTELFINYWRTYRLFYDFHKTPLHTTILLSL